MPAQSTRFVHAQTLRGDSLAENTFKVEIITPERVFYETEDATMIEFNTTEGEIGVYKEHIPLTTVIAPGMVTVTLEEGEKVAAVHAGFAQILPEKVTLLAEIAEWPEEIDEKRAMDAKERAQDRLEKKPEGLDIRRAELALRRALVRLDTKNYH